MTLYYTSQDLKKAFFFRKFFFGDFGPKLPPKEVFLLENVKKITKIFFHFFSLFLPKIVLSATETFFLPCEIFFGVEIS